MNLYRIHYAWKSGGASSSEIDYYESEDKFKVDLLRHHLDIQYENAKRDWPRLMLASLWHKRLGDKDSSRTTTRLIKVEKVVNDEWVPVEYHFIEPAVSLGDRIGTEPKE